MQNVGSSEILKARLFEYWNRYQSTGKVGYLGFVTPFEAQELRAALPKAAKECLCIWGGHEEAERVMLTFHEDADAAKCCCPISILVYTWYEGELTHRDVLGALMGEGIRRECLGDIFVRENEAAVIATDPMVPVLSEMRKIGRMAVSCRVEGQLPEGFEKQTEEHRGSVASLRLDCVVGCLAKLSRGKTEEMIATKQVFVNGVPEQREDRKLTLPATISVRGVGKFQVLQTSGETRKGRCIIVYQTYR